MSRFYTRERAKLGFSEIRLDGRVNDVSAEVFKGNQIRIKIRIQSRVSYKLTRSRPFFILVGPLLFNRIIYIDLIISLLFGTILIYAIGIFTKKDLIRITVIFYLFWLILYFLYLLTSHI